MRQSNKLTITGFIKKIYPPVITPYGVNVARFILEHKSQTDENGRMRMVICKMFCVLIGEELDNKLVDSYVEVDGFLNTNKEQQLVLHIQNIKKLD